MKKWIVGVGLLILSPVIVAGVILWEMIWKLPLFIYELAEENYKIMTEKRNNDWDK